MLGSVCVLSGRLVARCSKAGLAFGGGFCGAKLCVTDLRQHGQLLVRLGCLQLCILYTVCSVAVATTLLQVCVPCTGDFGCACRRYDLLPCDYDSLSTVTGASCSHFAGHTYDTNSVLHVAKWLNHNEFTTPCTCFKIVHDSCSQQLLSATEETMVIRIADACCLTSLAPDSTFANGSLTFITDGLH